MLVNTTDPATPVDDTHMHRRLIEGANPALKDITIEDIVVDHAICGVHPTERRGKKRETMG